MWALTAAELSETAPEQGQWALLCPQRPGYQTLDLGSASGQPWGLWDDSRKGGAQLCHTHTIASKSHKPSVLLPLPYELAPPCQPNRHATPWCRYRLEMGQASGMTTDT